MSKFPLIFSRHFQIRANVFLPFFLLFNVKRHFYQILTTWNRKYRYFFFSLDPSLRATAAESGSPLFKGSFSANGFLT